MCANVHSVNDAIQSWIFKPHIAIQLDIYHIGTSPKVSGCFYSMVPHPAHVASKAWKMAAAAQQRWPLAGPCELPEGQK